MVCIQPVSPHVYIKVWIYRSMQTTNTDLQIYKFHDIDLQQYIDLQQSYMYLYNNTQNIAHSYINKQTLSGQAISSYINRQLYLYIITKDQFWLIIKCCVMMRRTQINIKNTNTSNNATDQYTFIEQCATATLIFKRFIIPTNSTNLDQQIGQFCN